MGKRVFSLLLALAMVVGMVPVNAIPAFAADEQPEKVINAVYGEANVNGTMDEVRWLLTGQLTDEVSFGTMYKAGYLYVGLDAPVDDLAVTLNGVSVKVNSKKGESATEAWVSMAAAGLELTDYDQTASLKVTAGGNTWEGLVRFASSGWLHVSGGTPKYNAGDTALNGGSNNGGAFNFYTNKGGTSTATKDRVYASLGGEAQYLTSGTGVLAFDLQVDKMPQYSIDALNLPSSPNYFFPGLNLGVYHNNANDGTVQTAAQGYMIVVSRIKDYQQGYDGLYLLVASSVQKDSQPYIFALNKDLGEKFRLRFEYTPDTVDTFGGDLVVYCDDVCLGEMKDVADSRSYSTNGGSGINLNSWVEGADNVAAGEVNFTASKMIYGTLATGSVLDGLTVDQLLGENTAADVLTSDLVLPAKVADDMLGDVSLTWTSSDPSIIGHDGKLTGLASGEVTMTAALSGDPSVTKAFTFHTGSNKVLFAASGSVTMDGVLSEASWNMAGHLSETVNFGAVYNSGNLYLGFNGDVEGIAVALGGTSVTPEIVKGDAGAELKIALALTAYGQTVPLRITLGEDTWIGNVSFGSAKQTSITSYGTNSVKTSTDQLGTSNTGGTVRFWAIGNGESTAKELRAYQIYTAGNGMTDHTGVSVVSFNMNIAKMPQYDVAINGSSATWICQGMNLGVTFDRDGGYGYAMGITNLKNGGLTLVARQVTTGAYPYAVALNKQLGEDFSIRLEYSFSDKSLIVYCDDEKIATWSDIANCTHATAGNGVKNQFSINLYSNLTDYFAQDIDFTMSAVAIGNLRTGNLLDSLTLDQILGENTSANDVASNLTLPAKIVDEALGDVALSWTSSNPAIIGHDGKVTGEAFGAVTVTAALTGDPSQTKQFDLVVVPLDGTVYAVIANETVTPDGLLTEPTWVALSAEKLWLADAVWDDGYLYLALDTGDAASMKLTLDQKTWDITLGSTVSAEGISGAVVGGIAELKVDLSVAGIQLENYGETYDFQIELSSGVKLASNSISICFSGKELAPADWSDPMYQVGGSANMEGGSIAYNGSTSYVVSNHTQPGLAGWETVKEKFYITYDLTLTGLPELTAVPSFTAPTTTVDGLVFWVSDCYNITAKENSEYPNSAGDVLAVKFYNLNGELYVMVRDAAKDDQYDSYKLGVALNEAFTFGLYWAEDNSATVFVNGTALGTTANAGVYESGMGLDVVYFRCSTDGVSAEWSDMRILNDSYHTDVLDELTAEKVFASVDTAMVSSDLPMGSTVTTEHLGEVAVRWESSDPSVISADGKVTPPSYGTKTVTVSMYLADAEEPLWSVDVTVVDDSIKLDAVLAPDGVKVDGILNELVWVQWTELMPAGQDLPGGSAAAAWSKGHLYLAIVSDSAESADFVINGKTVTVDVTSGTVTGAEGALAAKNGNVVEVDLPLSELDVYPADYNDVTSLSVSFRNGQGTTASDVEKLCFSGKTVNIQAVSNTNSGWTFSGSVYHFEYTNDTTAHYIFATGNSFSLTETTYINQDLCFADLPVTDGGFCDAFSAKGYYYYASRNCGDYSVTGSGDMFFAVIYNAGEGNLKANLYANNATPNATVDLGVKVGDEFRLTTAWAADGSAKLYVNGLYVGSSNGNCTYRAKGCGDNVLSFRYRGTGTEDTVAFRLQNVTVAKTAYVRVVDELTPANVLNRADLERVTADLPMKDTYASKFFEAIPISWVTSDASVIEADGTIHRADTARSCKISLVYNGKTLWTRKVTVASLSETDAASPKQYTTAFANDVTIDGSLVGENWHMANKLLTADSILVGEMGAAWELDTLYVAIRNCGAQIDLKVNNVEIDLTQAETVTEGDYTEIAIPMELLNVEVTDYGLTIPVVVELSNGGAFEGTLVLSGSDWWGAGNAEDPLPMLPANVNSVATTGGSPNGNQGAVEVTNGWHLYDRYVEGSKNPAGVRTYILFMRTSPYENFAQRNGKTTVEFDFQAFSMPVYDETCMDTSNLEAFACYGLCWTLADAANSQKYSNVLAGGIYNSKDGLQLVLRGNGTYSYPLNKQVGDLFRITLDWNTDNSLEVYVDGVLLTTIDNMARWVGSVGDTSFVVNMIRGEENPESAADDMDVYITNIAFGSAYSDDPLDTLTWDAIRGENEVMTEVTKDLILPEKLTNYQLGIDYPLTWTSTVPEVLDPATGILNRPEKGALYVTLTAAMQDGSSKEFVLLIAGKTIDIGNTLVVSGDTNPSAGVGVAYETPLYTFDNNNNSLIEDMKTSQTINVVRLMDMDAYARINRESLTLWISEDNATYTEVTDYKLTQVGQYWYLYDFEATGRYVKVHYTHWNGEDADFIAPLNTVIHGYYEDVVGAGEGQWQSAAASWTNSGSVSRDVLAQLSKSALGITGEDASIRVYLNDSVLYHYVSGDTIYVRIPDLAVGASVEVTVLYGTEGAVDLANKEACYEITAGTRETYKLTTGARWLMTIPAGIYGEHVVEREMLLAVSGSTISGGYVLVSYDKGLTWSKLGTISQEAIDASLKGAKSDTGAGGWIFDEATGAIFFETHNYKVFDSSWENSDCVNVIIGSYDMGKTWELIDVVEPDTVDGKTYTYMLSYSDGITVSSYDGEGPNVDFVFPTGAQYTDTGAFCCRVVFSDDGGKTWQMSPSLLTYGEEKGHEGGLSEGWILENDDGVLVLYSRCQFAEIVNFAKAYSYDFGRTWTAYETREEWEANKDSEGNKITALISSVYSTNTQALMYKYPQYNGIDAPLFLWGGNTTLGGTSYIRTPMNVAVSYDGLDTFRNIQNLFSETYMDVYGMDGRSVITNHSVKKVGEDTMVMTYSRLRHGDTLWMTVSDFENYLYRTKGAYDNFESGNPFYEGWSATVGLIENTKNLASAGKQSLLIPKKSTVTRSIPYLQNGSISLDVYVTEDTVATLALQPAFGEDPNAYTLAAMKIAGMKLTCGDVVLDLEDGWNAVEIQLALTEAGATVAVNGGAAVALPLDMEVSDYVCYVSIYSETDIHIDEFTVVSTLDAEIYTGETQKEPEAEIVESSISLKGNVDVNVYVDMNAAAAADEDAYMLFTMADGEKIKVPVSEAEKKTEGDKPLYLFRCDVPAKEMTETVMAQFFYGDGKSTVEKPYSVKGYGDYILDDETGAYGDKLKTLVSNMLHYGAAAQKYFEHKTDDLASDGLEPVILDGVTAEALSEHAAEAESSNLVTFYGNSLILKSETTLRFFFQVSEGAQLTVTLNGEELEVKQRGGLYYVSVENISAKDLDQDVTVKVHDGETEFSVTANALTYAYNVLDAADGTYTDELEDLVKTLYLYNQAANTYFDNN